MTLQVYTLALGNFRDDTSGNNYAANTPVYILNSGGTLADIFRDQAGAQPIVQDGLNNVSGAYGEFTFYVNSGQYISRVAGRDRLINVVGSDYFDSRVDDAVEQITQQTLASRGFRVAGTFADGFTYELFNDVGIDADGNSWIYVGAGAPDKVVTAGTVPSVSAGYEQVTFNAASAVSNANGGSAQDFIDSFALKIFQSPTNGGLTKIQTRTVDAGEVYEVRKTSDDSLATIYSDSAGTTETAQNGTANVSGGGGIVEFYIAGGSYYVEVSGVRANFKSFSHSLLPDLNSAGGHDAIYPRVFQSVASMASYTGHVVNNSVSVVNGLFSTAYKVTSTEGDIALNGGLFATAVNAPKPKDYIGMLAAKMKAGIAVKIGCFGDSTTDGVGTTAWVKNPTSGGLAVGNSDHNLTAPNAWPAKLQAILRDMYKNNNIKTLNAGYTDQKMEDGWANDNYQAAMIDNPFYGVPDALFIQFGINDTVTAGSELADFVKQYRIFIRRVIDDGTLPILMTTDAIWSKVTGAFARPADEAQREYNAAIKALASEFDLPVIDMYDIERKWLQDNTDGYSWRSVQPDTLHLKDDGHSFKAQIPAMMFFNDAVEFDGGEVYVNSWSSQCDSLGDNGSVFVNANNKQGGVYTVSGLANDTDLMTMWVWSTSADANLVYLGFATEGLFVSTLPSIDVRNYITLATVSKEIPSANGQYVAGGSNSDIPYIFGKLHYGLNKVVYKSSDASQQFTGGFKLVAGKFGGNCLKDTGAISNEYTNATGVHFQLPVESSTLDNVSSMFEGESSTIKFKANIPIGCGIILSSGRATDGTASAVTKDLQCSTLLLRSSADRLTLQNLFTNNAGAITDITVDSIAGLTLTDAIAGSVRIYKDAGVQKIDLYDSFSGGSILGTFTAPSGKEIRYGGVCGGLFANTDAPPSGDVLVEINEMVIVR